MLKQTELPVYNYIYENNNLTWGKYMSLVRCGLHEPLDKALWYTNFSFDLLHIYKVLICRYFSYFIISSKSLYNVANFICHTIPGYILDGVAGLSGRKRM